MAQKKDQKQQNWFGVLLSFASGGKQKMILTVLLSVISIVSGLVPFYCVYRMIDAYITERLSGGVILRWGILAAAFYCVKILCFGLSTAVSHSVAYHVLEGLRLKVADTFLNAPLGEVYAHSVGEIKNVLVDRIEQIEPPLAHMIPEGSGHIALPIVCLICLFAIDWRVALSSLLAFPIGILFMMLTFIISGKNMTKYMNANDRLSSVIVEYIEGIEVIRTFGQAGKSYEKYAGAVQEYKDFVIEWMKSTWISMKLAFAFMPATLLGVVPVSLVLVQEGSITVSQMALAVMLAMAMIVSFARLEAFANNLRQMKYTVEQTEKLLEVRRLPEPVKTKNPSSYDICIRDVHFSYATDAPEALRGISLSLPQGSYTALVGPSGSGKTTLARLIARFWDVTKGSITIGGIDIRDMTVTQLSNIISFVMQDNFLFDCSVRDNIRLGKPCASEKEVEAAARAAACDEFIPRLDGGYDASSGEAGKKLSGGEKQRIAIARMILKDSPVVILDEATAFTDPENEVKIQASLSRLADDKTLLVIAHRLSTIRNADRIIVMNDGGIEAEGTHEELLASSPLYQKMWEAHVGAKHWTLNRKEASANV